MVGLRAWREARDQMQFLDPVRVYRLRRAFCFLSFAISLSSILGLGCDALNTYLHPDSSGSLPTRRFV
jgi:hypothetical protein